MVRRRDDFPSRGELIIGTVREINPNSVFVELDEYDAEGMIHISEIAKKWVRDIRDWVSVDKKVVCKVKDVRKDKGQIDLSLKEVDDRVKNRRMQRWKRDERGEDFLEKMAGGEDKELDEIYDEIGFELQENFKDMLEPFEVAVRKGTEELEKRGLDKEWAEKIKDVGEENIKRKAEELSERFTLRVWESDGADIIKNAFEEVSGERNVDFKYISAPEYEMVTEARDLKEGEKTLEASIKDLRKRLEGKEFELKSSLD